MKTKLQLLSFCFTLLFMVSCGSDDPKKNAEKAGECKCEYEELDAKKIKLQEDLLKTYEKNKRKIKNPNFGDEEWEDEEYIWQKEVDDWDEHTRIILEMNELRKEYIELEINIAEYRMQAYEASDNQDDYDDWIEEFNEEFDDYVEDNCEKLSGRNSKNRDKFFDKEDDYFDEIEEDYDYR